MKLLTPFVRILALTAPLLLTGILAAQEPAAAAGGGEQSVMSDLIENAGFIGYVIMLMSIIALALITLGAVAIAGDRLRSFSLSGGD